MEMFKIEAELLHPAYIWQGTCFGVPDKGTRVTLYPRGYSEDGLFCGVAYKVLGRRLLGDLSAPLERVRELLPHTAITQLESWLVSRVEHTATT